MGKAPVLNLDLFEPERPTIRIRTAPGEEGKLYELRIKDELSIEAMSTIVGLGEKAEGLQSGDMSHEEMVLFEEFIDGTLRIAFVADYDAELKGKLSVLQKTEIVEVFTRVCLGVTQEDLDKVLEARQTKTGVQ